MADVFISYSSKDISSAEYLLKTLESMYLTCWMAPRDIPPGKNYADVIPSAIERSKVVVILVSEHSQNSEQVQNELSLATSKERIMLPLLLDDAPIGNIFNYHLSRKVWTEANGRLVAAVSELTTRIHEEIAKLPPDIERESADVVMLRALPMAWILLLAGCVTVLIGTASILYILHLLRVKVLVTICIITILAALAAVALIRTPLFRTDHPFRRKLLKLLEIIKDL